ncbi:MAG TPA: ATP-binding cassette domain-containing protein, partial [Pseudohaliea sp.]|nr:ATP-binding cassette domain-containing protein [Pseudohaliea sp.]
QQASEDHAARFSSVLAPQLAAALLLGGTLLAFALLLPVLILPWLALIAVLVTLRALHGRVAGHMLSAADRHRQRLDDELDRWLRVSSLWSLQPAWVNGAATAGRAAAYARARRRSERLQLQLDGLLLVLGVAAATVLAEALATAPATALHAVPLVLLATLRDWTAGAFAAQARGRATRLSAALLPEPGATAAAEAAKKAPAAVAALELRAAGWARDGRAGPRLSAELAAPGLYLLQGPSGVGKTSLFLALCGELPLTGEVFLDGESVSRLTPAERRRRLYLAEQFTHVLSDTLAHNLRLGAPDATDQALHEALAWACLDDLAATGGLAQWLGNEGRPLSGGERKRLALARARLTDAPVWLLDEPFEGVDPKRRQVLAERLNREAQRRLVIVAAHRTPAALAPTGRLRLGDGAAG